MLQASDGRHLPVGRSQRTRCLLLRSVAVVSLTVPWPVAAQHSPIVETDSLHPYIESRSAPARSTQSGVPCASFFAALPNTTGDNLVDLVRRADSYCVWELEWTSDRATQIATARQGHVVAVGNGAARVMRNYDGRGRQGIKNLFNFLRWPGTSTTGASSAGPAATRLRRLSFTPWTRAPNWSPMS